ncbi:MAG: BrnT family toxin [Atopobiaceae bacterium]|nr:BrnT family toxin [Atopobiaceae bacterium]
MSNTSELYFVWDEGKARTNLAKHGISFEEAASAFHDAFARVIDDPDHSLDEERFVLLGLSLRARVLVVVHCLRDGGRAIRIISARRATHAEERTYWRFWHAQ